MNAHYMQQVKIECPVCGKEVDELVVWRNLNGIPFCACADCIKASSDRMKPDEYHLCTRGCLKCEHELSVKLALLVDAALKMGFRAGHDAATAGVRDFLSKMPKKVPMPPRKGRKAMG